MSEKILCVDDERNVVEGYQRTLRKQFSIEIAISGEEAIEMLKTKGPYAVVVSDMRMPGMNGIELLMQTAELAPETIRVMLTGNADQQTAIDAVNQGQIFRFLTKPCSPEMLQNALEAALQQYRLLRVEKDLLENTLTGSLQVVTDILAMVNPTAFGRASRVRRLVKQLASLMKVEHAWQVEIAALFSQIGCITVPEDVLQKAYEGGVLTPEELRMLQNHPKIGHDLISRIPRLEPVAEIIVHQLSNETKSERSAPPSLGARILNLALDFDKLIEARLSSSQAFAEITRRSKNYDQPALQALQEVVAHSETMYEMREVTIEDLEVQTILAEDVLAVSGFLLVAKGQEITSSLHTRLKNFYMRGSIPQIVKVFARIETPSYRKEPSQLEPAMA